MKALERLERIEKIQRDLDDERSALLSSLGWVQVDQRGFRWRDPIHGDAITSTAAVHRVTLELRA